MQSQKIDQIKAEIVAANAKTPEELEAYRMRFISKKSVVGALFADLKSIPNEQKKEYGQQVNEVKQLAEEKFKQLIDGVNTSRQQRTGPRPDLSLPPTTWPV